MSSSNFIDWLNHAIQRSNYLDIDHLWSLVPALLIAFDFYLDSHVFTGALTSIVNQSGLIGIFNLSLQGLVASIVTLSIYSIGNKSFKVGNQMQSKEKALAVVIFVMLTVGSAVEVLVPRVVALLSYPGIQTAGLVISIGFVYLHLLVEDWKLENEVPHLLAAALLVLGPQL